MIVFENDLPTRQTKDLVVCNAYYAWEKQNKKNGFFFTFSDIQFHICNFPLLSYIVSSKRILTAYKNWNIIHPECMLFQKVFDKCQSDGWCQMVYITESNSSMLYNWRFLFPSSFFLHLGNKEKRLTIVPFPFLSSSVKIAMLFAIIE